MSKHKWFINKNTFPFDKLDLQTEIIMEFEDREESRGPAGYYSWDNPSFSFTVVRWRYLTKVEKLAQKLMEL